MSRAWPVKGIEPDGPLLENARRVLQVRVAEFYSYTVTVPIESAVTAHHDLRIATKRLRYTLEMFRSVFAPAGDRQIERTKTLQEVLGNLHDSDVRIKMIEDEVAAVAVEQVGAVSRALAGAPATDHSAITTSALRPPPDDPRRGLYSLLGREYATRRQQYREFVDLWLSLERDGMRSDLARLSSLPVPADRADAVELGSDDDAKPGR